MAESAASLEGLDRINPSVEIAVVDTQRVVRQGEIEELERRRVAAILADPTVQPPPWADVLIQSMGKLAEAVGALNQRMEVVESLAARQSVAPPREPASLAQPLEEPESVKEGLREAQWQRTVQRLAGVEPESRLEAHPIVALQPRVCRACNQNKPYRPSKYCLPCLQTMNEGLCPRCGNPLNPEGECLTCAMEAAQLAKLKNGIRHPVGAYTHEAVEIIEEGFPP